MEPSVTCGFPWQRVIDDENSFMSWRHHGKGMCMFHSMVHHRHRISMKTVWWRVIGAENSSMSWLHHGKAMCMLHSMFHHFYSTISMEIVCGLGPVNPLSEPLQQLGLYICVRSASKHFNQINIYDQISTSLLYVIQEASSFRDWLIEAEWRTYSISQEICTRFLLCCALLWLHIDWFSHIHQAYFTGTVAI